MKNLKTRVVLEDRTYTAIEEIATGEKKVYPNIIANAIIDFLAETFAGLNEDEVNELTKIAYYRLDNKRDFFFAVRGRLFVAKAYPFVEELT